MIEAETQTIEVEVVTNTEVTSTGQVEVETVDLSDLDITVAKKEYVITGDDIYIPMLYDDAPQWMKNLVQVVVDVSISSGNQSLINDMNAIIQDFAVSYVPLNQYTQTILDLGDEDTRLNVLIETLNSNFNDGLSTANAQITSLQLTKASKDEVVAQVIQTIAAQLADGASNIGSTIGRIDQAIANETSARALSLQTLTASLEDTNLDVTANAEVIQNALAYVGIDEAGASTGTGLSAYLEDSNGNIGGADSELANSIRVTAEGVESKFAYNSLLNINGVYKKSGFGLTTNYISGAGTQANPYVSEFWIDASRFKFTNSNVTGSVAPFTIDASGSQPQITFNGKVTFGSGQTGTIDQAIAAVVEIVTVGDKNINITDNLIPTTSLVADTDNSGYQFIGTPTKSMSAGLESFSEAQIILDGSDEVYSPYVDEVTIPYYYRFGTKGIANLDRFKIVTIDSSNVVLYNDITVTMEVGQSLSAVNWYTVDGVINPTGGVIAADGDIRDINGVKVGSVNNFVMPSGTTKVLLGWIADCTISRIKMCKITADTITSDFSSVNGQLVNLQSQIDNVDVSWNSLSGKDVLAQKFGYATYSALESAATAGQTVVVGGKINTELIDANAINASQINTTGLIAENISANEIVGKTMTGAVINGAAINGAVIKASYLDLDGELEVLTNYHITPAMYAANPSLYTDAVYIEGNNEYRIPSISTVREATVTQDISANGAVFNSKIRSYNCSNAGHNMKCVKETPTFSCSTDTLLFSISEATYNPYSRNTISSLVTILIGGISIGSFRYIVNSISSQADNVSGGTDAIKVYRNGSIVYTYTDNWSAGNITDDPLINPNAYMRITVSSINFRLKVTSFGGFSLYLENGTYILPNTFTSTGSSFISMSTSDKNGIVTASTSASIYINNMI